MAVNDLTSTNEALRRNMEELRKQNEDTAKENRELKEQLALLMKRVDAITNNAPISSESSTQIPIQTSYYSTAIPFTPIPLPNPLIPDIPPQQPELAQSSFSYSPGMFNPSPPYNVAPFPRTILHQAPATITLADDEKARPDEKPDWLESFNYLKEKFDSLEIGHGLEGLDPYETCLVPDVVIPPKFKMPEFEKYSGTGCPRAHLRHFCSRMSAHLRDDSLLIFCFQESLAGPALRWYMGLTRVEIKKWKDLAEAFIKQYRHNLNLAPDRMYLQRMEMKKGENLRTYVQRWREAAAQVVPPLSERESISIFIDTLKEPYYEKCLVASDEDFLKIICIGDRIDRGISTGRITINNQSYEEDPFEDNEFQDDQYPEQGIMLDNFTMVQHGQHQFGGKS